MRSGTVGTLIGLHLIFKGGFELAILSIGGADMPDPSSLTVKYQDVDSDNSKRNGAGYLQRDRLRGGNTVAHTLSCKWTAASVTEAHTILTAVSAASFSVKFYDPRTAGDLTITAYVGDRSGDTLVAQVGKRFAISFDLVEY